MDYKEVNRRLRLPFGNITAVSPNDRCIWKSLAIAKGAVLTSPFNQASWADNRLLPVEAVPYMYLITIDPNNGESTYTIRVPAGQTPNPTTPTRSGYIFDGWSPTIVPATADATYTAQWVPDVVQYTINFMDPGNTSWTTVTQTVNQGSIIPGPSTIPSKPDTEEYSYIFTGWIDQDDPTSNFEKNSTVATKNTTYIAVYNQQSIPNNNVKTMDNMGQILNTDKSTPVNLSKYAPAAGHWWSGPHDGHTADVAGNDGGISPTGSVTGRRQVVVDGVTYTHYDGDSIVYEFLTDTGALDKQNNAVTGSDLTDNWTGYDSNGNAVFSIKSNTPWIKFAVLKTSAVSPGYSIPVTFKDQQGINQDITISSVPVAVMVEYYIADNPNNSARAGSINVTTTGGDCSYVASAWSPNNKYMTDGDVFFYQLGQVYTPVN